MYICRYAYDSPLNKKILCINGIKKLQIEIDNFVDKNVECYCDCANSQIKCKYYFRNPEYPSPIRRLIEKTCDVSLINLLIQLYKEKKITINYYSGRTDTDITIFIPEEDEVVSSTLNHLSKAIRDFYNNKCVVCGMTKDEHYDRYDRNLEIHHIVPVSWERSVKDTFITDMFELRCMACNPRGRNQ